VITFNGTNDAPTIPTNPGVTSEIITKLANTTGSNTPDTASGTFAFNDTNLSDQHTFTHNLVSDTLSSGTVIPAATLAALTNGLSLTEVDSTGTGTGSVTWTLSAADKNFDFLAQGQSLTAVYGIGISDGHGGSVTEPVSVTINGAYAPPTITTAQLTGSVTGTSAPASGVIHFTSPELIDTHSIVSYSLLSTTAQPETASNGVSTGAIGALGTFTANLVQDSTNGATGAIDWSYNLSSLPQGSPITETWGIVMQDASGHQVTEDVAVTISQASSQLGVPVRVDTFPNGDTYNTGSGYAAMGFDLVYGPGATPSNEVGYRFVVYGSDPYYQTGAVDQIHTSTNNIASIPNNHVVTIEAIANYLYGPSFTFQVAIPIDTTPPLTGLWETQHIVPVNPSTIHFV
jgi:VCBS repeat-containing protein